MIINEITVCFKNPDGSWDEEETYTIDPKQSDLTKNILSETAPLVQLVRELEENEVGKLPTEEQFLLVRKQVTYVLDDYLNNIENLYNYTEEYILKISKNFPTLLSEAIEIPEKTEELFNLIITVKLNNEDINTCTVWLIEVKRSGISVDDILKKLNSIKSEQKGIEIEDIDDVFTLNRISDLYKDLKAIKKAKTILLRSLQINKRNKYTLNMLGKISRLSSSYQEGINFYLKALEVEENAYSYNGLGAIYRDINELHEAERCYITALNLNEKHDLSVSHRGLGAVYYDMELYNKGDEHFILAGFDEYISAKRKNSHEKAVEILRLILSFDKNHVKARDLLNEEIGIDVREEGDF
jgi:tetratricopeptide (TPR) repeat protein